VPKPVGLKKIERETMGEPFIRTTTLAETRNVLSVIKRVMLQHSAGITLEEVTKEQTSDLEQCRDKDPLATIEDPNSNRGSKDAVETKGAHNKDDVNNRKELVNNDASGVIIVRLPLTTLTIAGIKRATSTVIDVRKRLRALVATNVESAPVMSVGSQDTSRKTAPPQNECRTVSSDSPGREHVDCQGM